MLFDPTPIAPMPAMGALFVPPNLQSISQEIADITQLHGALRDNIAAGVGVELDAAGAVVPAVGNEVFAYIGDTLADAGRLLANMRALFQAHVDGTLNATSQLWSDLESIISPETRSLPPQPRPSRVSVPVSTVPPAGASPPSVGASGPAVSISPGGAAGVAGSAGVASICAPPPPSPAALAMLSARDAAGNLNWPLGDWPLDVFTPNCHHGFYYTFQPTPRSVWEVTLGVIGSPATQVPFGLYFNLQSNVDASQMIALPGLDGFPIASAVPMNPNDVYQTFVAQYGVQLVEQCLAATLCEGKPATGTTPTRPGVGVPPIGSGGGAGGPGPTMPAGGGSGGGAGGPGPTMPAAGGGGIITPTIGPSPCIGVQGRITGSGDTVGVLDYWVNPVPPQGPCAYEVLSTNIGWGPPPWARDTLLPDAGVTSFPTEQAAHDYAWFNYVLPCCQGQPPPPIITPTPPPTAGSCPPPTIVVNPPPCPPPVVTCPECGHKSNGEGDAGMSDWEYLMSADSETLIDEMAAWVGSEAVQFLNGGSVIESMARIGDFTPQSEDRG